ncbi:MAG: beta-ketoacyl-ACP synthase II [Gammaproteobacteria bacterium]|nr:beta-ketoacyl-ACP synthase II [Gammaproteobacteria bacterium]
MSKRRVVVTGLGVVSPLGLTVAETWQGILAGNSGISPVTHFDVSHFPVRFGGTVKGFDSAAVVGQKDMKKMDNFIHYGIAAANEAMADSGLQVTEQNAERIGVAIGSGIGGLGTIERNYDAYKEGGQRKISPFLIPASIINMISGHVSIRYGLKGPNIAIVTACATATHSIGDAGRMIEYGDADVMLAGGAEMATTALGLGGFAAARALSTRNGDPQTASRPWDQDRDGFVLSDGAGVLVLEEYEHAKQRGARIYAELIGYGMSGDAYHMTSPAEGGDGAKRCMCNAMRNAAINPEQVSYINAHGTSTPQGDVAEIHAVKGAFSHYAAKVAMSSTKSMTGHLLGAAGGIEAVFCILAIRDQVAPPTINIFKQDPQCDLDLIPGTARPMPITIAMSNSFGFGGTNGTLLFRKL